MSRTAVRGDRAWVAGLGVVPEFRGKGISKILLRYYLDRLRASGLKRVQLECIVDNAPAYNLYLKNGFVKQRKLIHLNINGEFCWILPREPSRCASSTTWSILPFPGRSPGIVTRGEASGPPFY
ncbi:acyl-CoA N-acyltransferase [Jimgerdemannia flammicorona]|uniref:Acyl-CoA N-acyltransferase n=1 Tax=Jimgerdemannia flammicorona TaxID=994334 RepID=A0A433QNG3_9FUNG|nr:acyl-CoA N-acyltransferase [Jimgerdemannia flammicorona]